ncbi:MAG: hypothetical protein L3K06_03535 [Thermoplasmata archaeon]|nr:hypothetical protein [Thermoplasmata archaeon]MCI4354419.1 hypothetical protein [Thermoplasmata archaeon]
MKLVRLLPMVFGGVILLLGIYLVSSHGSIAGVNLPTVLGLPQCDTGANATPCAGLGLYGGVGVGTIVAIFGLGLLASAFRSSMMSASMGAGTMPGGVPPELLATLQQAQARMAGLPPTGGGGPPGTPDPAYKFCPKCGTRTESSSRFCKSCGSAL